MLKLIEDYLFFSWSNYRFKYVFQTKEICHLRYNLRTARKQKVEKQNFDSFRQITTKNKYLKLIGHSLFCKMYLFYLSEFHTRL
jgi:hypothetical protein